MRSVLSVSKSNTHSFSKNRCSSIILINGLGVEGDAHMGEKVKHRSRVKQDPAQPNLRQVHLMQSELFDELKSQGFEVSPAQMGENITTKGIDLLKLPRNTILAIGKSAKIQITGLRNPCYQLNSIKEGLMNEVLEKDEQGNLIRKAGIMGIVIAGGEISVGDDISIHLPDQPHFNLEPV